MATYVGDKAEQAGDSKALEVLARIGLGRLRRRTPPGRMARAADRVGPDAQRQRRHLRAMKTLLINPSACRVPEPGHGV